MKGIKNESEQQKVHQQIETLLMVNFGQKTAIFDPWNFAQKKNTKIAWNHLETLSVSQKLTNLKFETTFGFTKTDEFPNRQLKLSFEVWN